MTDDLSRHVATSSDTDYSLSIDAAAVLYERAGLPRTLRSIQRYCAKGHLDARRIETAYGEKYLMAPASVIRHIAYIEEVRQATAGRDELRHVATSRDNDDEPGIEETGLVATSPDMTRHDATEPEMTTRYVAGLERENEFLRGEITVKNDQIKDLTERARETNHLIAGLQKMLTPLLGRPSASSPPERKDQGSETEVGG